MPDADADIVNTEIEMREYREILMKRRAELKARERDLRDLREIPGPDGYGYDSGDRAVHEDDKNRIARQIESQRAELRAVDAALTRIDEGTYGECLACGENISERRLRAISSAWLCAGCAEIQEQLQRV